MLDRNQWAEVLSFSVDGTAKPAGSKSAIAIMKNGKPVMKNGRVLTSVVDSSGQKGKDWRREVARCAKEAMRGLDLLDGPLLVEMTFRRRRPTGHYGSGKNSAVLKPSAEPFPVPKPDVLKLARGAEDACTGIVWVDDAQTVSLLIHKRYVPRLALEGVDITVSIWIG